MMRYGLILLPLTLAACGGGEGASDNGSGADRSAGVEEAPVNLQDDPGNRVVPIGNAVSAAPMAAAVTAIPAEFRGRWGMVPNDCDPARADGKGLMTVAADRLAFYESRAVPANIRITRPGALTTELAFSGEGQSWRQVATMTLLDDGKTLVREVTEGDDLGMKGAQRYTRCPA